MLKSLIKKTFERAGLKVSRAPFVAPPPADGIYHLRFGRFDISSRSVQQVKSYAEYPETNQALGRLAEMVGRKRPHSGIVDIGANCGDTAAIIRSSTDLPILCVEGDDGLFKTLSANGVQLPEVTLVQHYLGEKTETGSVKVEKEGWNNTLVPSAGEGRQIRLTRFDELEHPWLTTHTVGLLKCDTEGFDIRILFGARGVLQRDHPVLHFEYNRENLSGIGEDGLRLFPYLSGLGYRSVLFYDAFGRFLLSTDLQNESLILDLHDYADGVHGKVYYYDIAAFHETDEELAREFVKSERAYRAKTLESSK
jgi:FkbM family methyltransferase